MPSVSAKVYCPDGAGLALTQPVIVTGGGGGGFGASACCARSVAPRNAVATSAAIRVLGIGFPPRPVATSLYTESAPRDRQFFEYVSMTRSMARRQTAQKTSSRVNMMQSTCGPVVALRLVLGAFEGADLARVRSRARGVVPLRSSRRERPSRLRGGSRRESWRGAPRSRATRFSYASFGQGVGSGVPGVTRSFHLSVAGSSSAVTFGSHGSSPFRRRQVGHGRRVVLVGERREVVAELVDEDVRRHGLSAATVL